MWNTVESNRTSNLERHIQMRIRYRERERDRLIDRYPRKETSEQDKHSTKTHQAKQSGLEIEDFNIESQRSI